MVKVGKLSGFTIVELLIVVVIIGILSAIVVVAYNGVTKNARNVSVQSDVKNFSKKIDIRKAIDGRYPISSDLSASDGITVNKDLYIPGASNNWYYCVTSDRSRFAVGATAESARDGYVYDSETGLRAQAGLWGASTCPNAVAGDPYNGGYIYVGCSWSAGACTWLSWING